jgi:hypothetical protein
MTPIERELRRAAVKNKKERLSGIHNEVCLGCGCDLAQGKEDDHMAGCMLIPEEAAPQFLDDAAPHNGMMPPPDSEMIAPPISE